MSDLPAHAATIALKKHGKELEEALGRAPAASDFTAQSCTNVTLLDDLDGDGTQDSDVALCMPPGGHIWDHYVYFSNKGCPRFADHIVDGPLASLPTKHRDVHDLESTGVGGCAGADFTWKRRIWTGSGYRVADTVSCELCDEVALSKPGPGARRHPRCLQAWARMRIRP